MPVHHSDESLSCGYTLKREKSYFSTHLYVQQGQHTSVLVLNANMSSLPGDKSPKCQLFSNTKKQPRYSLACKHFELIVF